MTAVVYNAKLHKQPGFKVVFKHGQRETTVDSILVHFFGNRFSEFHILEYTIILRQILDANETKLVDGCSRREAADLWSDITSFCVPQGLYNVFNCPFLFICFWYICFVLLSASFYCTPTIY